MTNDVTFQQTWQQIELLHGHGINLIAVRDKHEGDMLPKTPYRGWKKYQTERIELGQLYHDLEYYKTNAVAIICGSISGNLECIDIDVKYNPGIDAQLFNDLYTLYPGLYTRLRIHRSPSGGFHILYRCTDPIPGNKKLASREPNTDELAADPKAKAKCFLETRGEGGYVLCPPSLGYTVHQERPIPLLTSEERATIITLCMAYNQVIKIKEPPKAAATDSSYYDQNPFEHFNATADPTELLAPLGWSVHGSNSNFIWYTRPGKDRGVSASFNREKRIFYVFTSSTQLEPDRGYHPATMVAELLFDGDKKKTYAYLVQQGYGKVKTNVESRRAKTAAIQNKPLPANFSEAAQTEYQETRNTLAATHPHGIYWKLDEDGAVTISRERLYDVAAAMGFRNHNGEVVQIIAPFIHQVTPRSFFDTLKAYIKEPDPELYEQVANAYEAFIQRAGTFTIDRIQLLDTAPIINDTPSVCHKFYENGFIVITPAGYTFHEWHQLNTDALVWFDRVQPRTFTPSAPSESGKYVDYLSKATEYTAHPEHIERIIGYLAHDYKDETTGYIIVCVEQCANPKEGGGSGKNIFCSLFAHTTTFTSVPGSQTKFDEKFLQAWNGERIFAISDVPENFDFIFLKELATGSAKIKKLYKDERTVNVRDMCKLIVQTNYSYKCSDGGLKRRLIPIEFTNYFTLKGGVDVEYGCHFPTGWDAADWNGYDNFIAKCVVQWLRNSRKLSPLPLSVTGWEKQFKHTYGQTCYDLITSHWEYWMRIGFITADTFKTELEKFYNDNSINHAHRPAIKKINEAIAEYAAHHNAVFEKDTVRKDALGASVRGRSFLPKAPF